MFGKQYQTKPYILFSILLITLLLFPIIFSLATGNTVTENKRIDIKQLSFLNKISDEKIYLYFGYVGCVDTCPTALSHVDNNQENLPVYFINLIPGLEDNQVQSYVNTLGVDNTFGLQPTLADLKEIESIFSNLSNGRVGVFNPNIHTDQVFLIVKKDSFWQLINRFNNSLSVRSL